MAAGWNVRVTTFDFEGKPGTVRNFLAYEPDKERAVELVCKRVPVREGEQAEQARAPRRRDAVALGGCATHTSAIFIILRRGFAQWILVPLVALLWPWCPLQYWANCDCLMCSCVPCTALLDVAVHLLEEGLQPCCCRNN